MNSGDNFESINTSADAQPLGTPAESVYRSTDALLHELQAHQAELEMQNHELQVYRLELEMQNEALRQNQLSLDESRDRYRELFDFAPVGYVVLSIQGMITEVNQAAANLLGIDRSLLLFGRFASFVAPSDGDNWYLLFKQILQCNQTLHVELKLKNSQGEEIPVQLNCLSNNESVRVSITDLSKTKHAEVVLLEAEVTRAIMTERLLLAKKQEDLLCRLQNIANSVPGVIYQYRLRPDGSSCFPYASEALFDIYRLRPEEVREDASKAYALIHPEDCEGFIASIDASVRDLTPWYYEYRIKFDDGTVRWVLGNSLPQREADGSTLWNGFSTDITDRKMLEYRLSESEARWKFAIEGSGDGVWDRNLQTHEIEYSHRWKEMYGYSEIDELPTNTDWQSNIHPDDHDYVLSLIQAYFEGTSSSMCAEYRMRCKDNSYKWILSRSKIVSYNEHGQPLRMVGVHTDISQRKQAEIELRSNQAEIELRSNQAELHQAMRIANMGSWQLDLLTGQLFWSEELYHIAGLNPNLPSPSYKEQSSLFTAESWVLATSAVELIQQNGIPYEIELEMINLDGTHRCVISRAEVIRDANEKIIGLRGMVQDITERKKKDQLLRQLKAMTEVSLDGFYIADLLGNIVVVNHAYALMLGYTTEELTGMNLNQLEAIENTKQIKAHIEQIVTQGFHLFETCQYHKDGHSIELELSVAYLAEYQQLCVFSRDISQRKAMDIELKNSESKFRTIFNASPVSMAIVTLNSEFVLLNKAFVDSFGYDLEDLHTYDDWQLRAYPDPDYRDWVKAMGQKIKNSAQVDQRDFIQLEVSIRCKNNSIKTALGSFTLMNDNENSMGLVVLYDITERKQVEAQYNSIFNASVEGIITVNINNLVVASNPAIETIFGYTTDELLNCPTQKLLPSFSDDSHKLSLSYPEQLIVKIHEIEGLHKNGDLIHLDLTIAEYAINNTPYFTYIVRDITQRKIRELQDKEHLDQLAHVGRLGLMGEMASGMAHEVNQPLTAIAAYAQVSLNLMKKENPDLVKLAEIAVKTQEQALRAGQIIHGMKRFCKSKSQQRSVIDINELINDSIKLCADQLKQNSVELTFKLETMLPLISVDTIQIEQVLVNLIRNGVDAILSVDEMKQGQIAIQSELMPNNEIKVSVQDNGLGIQDEEQLKILMPFHTTKAEGMGMGLSISRALIEAHNGKLNFKSQFGKGSTFYFTLPIGSV